MICEKCKAEGATSTIAVSPVVSKTLMGHSPYYDEQGRYHNHDPNRITQTGMCSRGHRFVRTYYDRCPSCDYGSSDTVAWHDPVASSTT